MILPKTDNRKPRLYSLYQLLRRHHRCGWAILLLIATLLLLSLLAGINFKTSRQLFLEGDIAQADVVADKDLYVEDYKATQERMEKALLLQPPVYDLTISPYLKFQEKLVSTMRILNNDQNTLSEEERKQLAELKDSLTPTISEEILPELARLEVQDVLLKSILPFILQKMSLGLVSDIRQSNVGRSGILIHDLDAKRDILRPELSILPDVHSMLAEISVKLRQNTRLNPQSRRALNVLLSTTLPPASLSLNQEATKRKQEEIRSSVKPVLYHIQRGESIKQQNMI